jgi:hypothetical protein
MKKIVLSIIFFISHATMPSFAQNQETVGGSQIMYPQQGGPLNNGPGGMRPINAKTNAPQSVPSSARSEPNALVEFLQKTCPFKAPRNEDDIINITIVMASNLAKNKCQAVSDATKSINDSLQRNLDKLFPSKKHMEGGLDQDPMMGGMNPGMMNMGMGQDSDICDTYALKASLDREDAYKIGAMDKSMLPMRYQQCGMSPNFDECVENVYQTDLIQGASKCKYSESNSKRNDKNKAIKSSIEDLTRSLQDVIQNSEGCSQETKQSLINNSLGIMSNLASVAVSKGFIAAGVSMTASLINSAVSVLSKERSPEKILNDIQEEDNDNDISCLGYMLSRNTFACDNRILGNSKTANNKEPVQQYDPEALKFMSSIKDIGNKILDTKNAYEKPDTRKGEDKKNFNPSSFSEVNDGFVKLINTKIQDPEDEDKEITIGNFLDRIATLLNQETTGKERRSGATIKKFLSMANEYDSFNKKRESIDFIDFEDQNKYIKQLSDASYDLLTTDSYGNVITRAIDYYIKKTESKTAHNFFDKIRNIENSAKEKAIGRGVSFEIAQSVGSQLQKGIEGRTVKIAYRAFLSSFKPFYEKRFKKLNTDLIAEYVHNERGEVFVGISNLARMCSIGNAPVLTESPSFSKLSLDIVKKTPSIYKESCDRFKCYIPMYNPEEALSEEERYKKFLELQCNNYYTLPVVMDKIENEFSSKGTVCGKPLR